MNEAQRKKFDSMWKSLFANRWNANNGSTPTVKEHEAVLIVNSVLSVSDGWIDVKERLPKHYGNVLALCQYGVGIAHRTRVTLDNGEVVEGLKWVYRPENDKSYSDGLSASYRTTHWMPLPSPPKDSPTSDGLEHSQHKCGCEEIDAIHKEEWEKQHAIIKAYREVLQNVVGNKGAWWIEAKEVLTRMEEEG